MSLAEEFTPVEEDEPDAQTRPEELRLLEALLFAAGEPLDEKALAGRMPAGADLRTALRRLQTEYAPRGVHLVRIGSKWAFRTANDLAWLLTHEAIQPKKLSRAALETLAIVAYHQPVTRAEIEEIRGIVGAKGTLDVLLEIGWIRPRGRRKAPVWRACRTCRASTSSRAPVCSMAACQPASTSRCRRTIPRCVRTRSRWRRATST